MNKKYEALENLFSVLAVITGFPILIVASSMDRFDLFFFWFVLGGIMGGVILGIYRTYLEMEDSSPTLSERKKAIKREGIQAAQRMKAPSESYKKDVERITRR